MVVQTSWGSVVVLGDERRLDYVGYPEPTSDEAIETTRRQFTDLGVYDPAGLAWARTAIEDYFDGRPIDWRDLPARLNGRELQLRVWEVCRSTRYGSTLTYGDVAALAGYRGAARAAGSALAANPSGLLIPCHRIVAAHGLGGYGGRPERKIALLSLEGIEFHSSTDPQQHFLAHPRGGYHRYDVQQAEGDKR